MAYAENEGVRIHYRVVGEGPPLVLQHGFLQNLKDWYLFGYVEALRQQYRLVLIDSRGHGSSDKLYDPDAYELSLQVADVVAVLDQLEISKTCFWGYSTGGRIGIGLAKWAPGRVSAVIVGGQDARPWRVPASVRIDPTHVEESLIEEMYATTKLSPEARERVGRQQILANDLRALEAVVRQGCLSLEDVLRSMTMPCLFYAGELDPAYSVLLKYAQAMPCATAVGLPGLDHTRAFSQSKVALEHVLGFLQCTVPPDSFNPSAQR
jgi:pimeloyl-ACP methyl ester carboxylesterase